MAGSGEKVGTADGAFNVTLDVVDPARNSFCDVAMVRIDAASLQRAAGGSGGPGYRLQFAAAHRRGAEPAGRTPHGPSGGAQACAAQDLPSNHHQIPLRPPDRRRQGTRNRQEPKAEKCSVSKPS